MHIIDGTWLLLFQAIPAVLNISIIVLFFISIDNTYERGNTIDNYPFTYTRIDCSGTEARLSSCSLSVSANIQYCSNKKIVKLKCAGKYYS